MTQLTWNPETPDQPVRLKNNPGKRGVTTGKVKESAGRLLVLVNFGPNENINNIINNSEWLLAEIYKFSEGIARHIPDYEAPEVKGFPKQFPDAPPPPPSVRPPRDTGYYPDDNSSM